MLLNNIDFDRMEQLDMPRIDDFSDDDATFEDEEEVVVVEEAVAEPAEAGTISGHYQLGGTVAGAGILMELDVRGGSVSGRYRYTKINPPSWLDVEGYFSEGRYFNFIETNGDEMTGEYDCEAVFVLMFVILIFLVFMGMVMDSAVDRKSVV